MEVAGAATGIAMAGIIGLSVLQRSAGRQNEALRVLHDPRYPQVDVVLVREVNTVSSQGVSGLVGLKPKPDGSVRMLLEYLGQQARILQYEYSADALARPRPHPWVKMWTQSHDLDYRALRNMPQTIYLHSTRLVADLDMLRKESACDRPIIWLAHGLGGLIVRNALVHASAALGREDRGRKAIQLSTCGALYYDTPVRGTKSKSWSELLATLVSNERPITLPPHLNVESEEFAVFQLQQERYRSIDKHFRNYVFTRRIKHGRQALKNSVQLQALPEESLTPKHGAKTWRRIILTTNAKSTESLNTIEIMNSQNALHAVKECLESAPFARERCRKYVRQIETWQTQSIQKFEMVIRDSRLADEDHELERSLSHSSSSTHQSIDILKEELHQSERHDDVSDRSILICLVILAHVYAKQGDFLFAELLYKRALVLVLDGETYGPWHRVTGSLLQRLAEVLIEQGKYADANCHFLHLLEIQKGEYGTASLPAVRTMAKIAVLHDKQQDWDRAQEFYNPAIKAAEDLGDKHIEELVNLQENLALSYCLRSRQTLQTSATLYIQVYNYRKQRFDLFKASRSTAHKVRSRKELTESSEYQCLWRVVSKLIEVYEELPDPSKRRKLLDDWAQCLSYDDEGESK